MNKNQLKSYDFYKNHPQMRSGNCRKFFNGLEKLKNLKKGGGAERCESTFSKRWILWAAAAAVFLVVSVSTIPAVLKYQKARHLAYQEKLYKDLTYSYASQLEGWEESDLNSWNLDYMNIDYSASDP